MKVRQLPRGSFTGVDPPSLSLSCKRFRPLAPHSSTHDLKASPSRSNTEVESQPGGTRWNPTEEQIGILEMVYRGGMRTPNSQQIEQIALQLSKFGKIEGKNVFYWFQNHKARERQKQKRNSLALARSSSLKRKSRSLCLEEDNRRSCKELQLFPLHPESR